VVFLGDNVYPNGVSLKNSIHETTRLKKQIDVIVSNKSKAFFIPGNHDWGKNGNNLTTLCNQMSIVNSNKPYTVFLPDCGYPGPELVNSNPEIIIIDSQWWFIKRQSEEIALKMRFQCIVDSLDYLLKSFNDTSLIIICTHHPLISFGQHGGTYSWQDHLFPLTRLNKHFWIPLPFAGTLYVVLRKFLFRSNQDLNSAAYQFFIKSLSDVIYRCNSSQLIFIASGHDHSLQVIHDGISTIYFLVSGAGSRSKLTPVRKNSNTLYAASHEGFMILDFLADRSVTIRVLETGNKNSAYFKKISYPWDTD
jgi:hypothetical protein